MVAIEIQNGLSRLKNTFFLAVGSLKIILVTIDIKMTEKLTVNACDLFSTTVEKKNAIEI